VSFYEEIRKAAEVVTAVNERFRAENPRSGFSANEPISPPSLRFLADLWEQNDRGTT